MQIAALEAKREKLLKELGDVGDMQSGSLSIRYQKCSKQPCVCHEPEHLGHGPIYSFSKVVDGKAKMQNLKEGPELSKLLKEVENYERFRSLTREIITVSDKISALRPVASTVSVSEEEALKKKLQKRFAQKYGKKLIIS